jgi:antibiotic biosynthesis monooxygenase (ABM) superfamily enzyme
MALAEAGTREAARLIQQRRRLDMLDAIAAWDTSHGPERAYWASQGSHLIRQWRRLYPHYWEVAA